MKRPVLLLATLVATTLPLTLAALAETAPASPTPADSAFARLKGLAGEWVGKAGPPAGEMMDAVVTYRVTAGGSAVLETLFPGAAHEMVTLYTLDRGAVALTHYCMLRNQPHMRARAGGPASELTFDFAGGANLDPARDEFMHDAKLVFLDPDHIRGEWTSWKDGKPAGTVVFKMERKK